MTSEAMSPLRRRMIEDMTVRKFVEKTQKDYIRYVKDLTAFLGRSPDTATAEDLRRYQLHLTNSGAHSPRINATVSALRFFFSVTLDRAEVSKLLTFVADPRKIPIVVSPEEVVRFLEAAPGPKYKAALSAAYGAGLRVSEVVALKVSDVDSERMLLVLRLAVQGLLRGRADDRDRSRAPGRPHRHHRRAPHLGLDHDPSPAPAHDRAGRRHRLGWEALAVLPAPAPRARAHQAVPGADAGEAPRRPHGRPAQILRPACSPYRAQGFRRLPGAAA